MWHTAVAQEICAREPQVSIIPYLFRRGAVYWWRRRRPAGPEICGSSPPSHVQVSLGVRELALARQLAAQLTVRSEDVFALVRLGMLNAAETNALLQGEIARLRSKYAALSAGDLHDGVRATEARRDRIAAAAFAMCAARGIKFELTAADRERLQTDHGLSRIEVDEIEPFLAGLVEARMLPPPPTKIARLLRHHHIPETATNFAQAQAIHLRANSIALSEQADIYDTGAFVDDAEALRAAARVGAEIVYSPSVKSAQARPQNSPTAAAPSAPPPPVAGAGAPPGKSLDQNVDLATADECLLGHTVLHRCATLLTKLQETVAAIPRQLAAAPSEPGLPEFRFLQFWPDFEKHKIDVREWKPDTAANGRSSAKLFQGFYPGASVADVFNGSLASDFKASYLQLPRLYDKKKIWRGLSLSKIIEETKGQPKLGRVTTNSANKHISNLSEYCDFLVLKKKVSEDVKTPFDGLFSPRKKGKAARRDHDMWPAELDRKFFSSPIYFGCNSIYRRYESGEEIHRDALFWVPLLGRTMGAREDEFCSRKVGDIAFMNTEIGSIAYLKIRDSKTDSSTRDVPFQEEILDFGFLEFRYYGRDPDEALFPELLPQGPGLRRSAAFTKRFAQARRKTGVLRPQVDFRSYRDTVQTVLSNTEGVTAGWIDELIGHESIIRQSEGTRYTKVLYMSILKQTIDKVRLPVDLAHLKYNGPRGAPASGSAEDIARYAALAQREMNKKAARKKSP